MKQNNTPLSHDNLVLRNLLDKYPYFLSQNIDSIHYKYNNTLASVLSMLKHATKLVELASILNRPFQIWRHQTQPNKHKICYRVKINDIKHVSLYQEENNDKLLAEQNFEKGVTRYSNYLELNSEHCIPHERFYLEIETYDGLVFQKGFPENDTPKDDIYDHDEALDSLGRLYNIPRRQYRANILPKDYSLTYPLFCDSKTEWDYYYETRLKNHITSFGKIPLYILMLENLFEITPQIKGRWKQVARMDNDVMDPESETKYMASTNWNNNVYDISYELKELPKNLQMPNLWDIYNVLEETFPISAKIFFQITENKSLQDQIQIKDKISINIKIKDNIKLNDNLKTDKGAY